VAEVITADKPAPPAGAKRDPLAGATLVLLTMSVAFATFMEVLDTTIVNVAVPHIAGDLGVSASQGTWVISSYSVASAIAVPLTGWLARRFGEVRMFVISVLLFTVMSMLCGLATSLPMLAFLRVMQGLVSGPMVPLSQTLLLSNYPPEKKGIALALWAMTVIVAPIFGPLLGGYITDNLSWPWIFYINAPIGILAGVVTWLLLRDRETPTQRQPIDVVGLVLLVVGVGALQLMLDNGNDLDWFGSPVVVALACAAAICLTFLVVWELTDKHPVIDLTLFSRRNFRYGVIALSFGIFGFFGTTVIFPLWLQTVMGYSATWAGLATAPVGILALIISPFVGKNIARFDLRIVTSVAFIIFGFTSFWYASFTLDASFAQLALPRFVQGAAIACFFVPINQIVLSGLPPNKLAAASGLSNFFRTVSASFATAICVTVWEHRAIYHHAILAERVTSFNRNATDYLDKLKSIGLPVQSAYAQLDQVITQQAFMLATDELFWALGFAFLALIALVWLAKPPFGSVGPGAGH
jgi:DHA2 family multidrug resistance protein